MSRPTVQSPLVWRFPAYQPALGFLIAAGAAALNLYAHPSGGVRLFSLVIGVVALLLAVAAVRMAFVVDGDGVAVRFLGRVRWVPWSQVKAIGLADVRGSETVRIVRLDDTQVDVPPSLLQSLRPMSKPRASARLRGIVTRIEALRPRPERLL